MTYQPQRLILVTGKTNSGKTTTLSALINDINENGDLILQGERVNA